MLGQIQIGLDRLFEDVLKRFKAADIVAQLARAVTKSAAPASHHRVDGRDDLAVDLLGTKTESAVAWQFGLSPHQLPGLKADKGGPDFVVMATGIEVKGMFAGGSHLIVPQKELLTR